MTDVEICFFTVGVSRWETWRFSDSECIVVANQLLRCHGSLSEILVAAVHESKTNVSVMPQECFVTMESASRRLMRSCCITFNTVNLGLGLQVQREGDRDLGINILFSARNHSLSGYILCLLAVASCGCTCVHEDRTSFVPSLLANILQIHFPILNFCTPLCPSSQWSSGGWPD
jgi:hypothetical protein